MSYKYSAKRAAQAAAILLGLADEKRMSYMKLLKLLYIADRESIAETDLPITGDTPVAMKHGTNLGNTYNLIKGHPIEGLELWQSYLETDGYDLELTSDPGKSELCKYEIEKLQEIFERYRDKDQFEVGELTHKFHEWKENNPGSSSVTIPLQDIIEGVGRSDDADEILHRRAESIYFAELFGA